MKKTTTWIAAPLLVALVAIIPEVAAQPGELSVQEKQAILDVLIIASTLKLYEEENNSYPNVADELVGVERLAVSMGSPYAQRIPPKDGWGNRYYYWSDGGDYLIVSMGEDGSMDEDYLRLDDLFDAAEGDGDDILFSDHEFLRRPMTYRDKTKITMADMRSLGTAMESYAIDANVYPGPTDGLVHVERVADALQPVYVRILPTKDAWGQPFLVWSNPMGYMLISTGADELPDIVYDAADEPDLPQGEGGAFSDPRRDIVLINGQFVQWPDGSQD